MTLVPRPLVSGVTIDPPGACDLDDAIDVHKHPDGWHFLVSIADVAEHVPADHAADQLAYQLAFSRYWGDPKQPMLPRELTENRLSLLPHEARDTITFTLDLDNRLEVTGLDIQKTRLRSAAKLSDDDVGEALNTPEHPCYRQWCEALELAYGLFEQRQNRGALAVFDLDNALRSNEEGKFVRMPQGAAHRPYLIVQELMMLVNHAVSAHLLDSGLTLLFRNHTTVEANVRERYLSQLEALMLEPTADVLEQINHQVAHLFERAHYSPVNQGHVGLNLPCYAHWTSPIRRYADLVNHRLLQAWLGGEQPPYSHGELEAIGAHLAEVADGLREARSRVKKETAFEALVQADEAALAELGGKQVSRLIESLEAGKIDLSSAHTADLHRRLTHDALTTSDLTRLFFVPSRQGLWPELKKAALTWLMDHLGEIFQVFNVGHHLYGWPPSDELMWHDTQSGPPHMPTFGVAVSMGQDGKHFTSERAVSSSKHHARQQALLSLLSRLAGLDLTLPSEPAEGTMDLSGPAMANPKGRLLEIAQGLKEAAPTFEMSEQGASHERRYTCVALVTLESQLYRSSPCVGHSKKEAERLASVDVLMQLPGEVVDGRKQTEKSIRLTPDKNPISVLQEWTVEFLQGHPLYDFERAGPGHAPVFVCTCEVNMGQGVKQWQGVAMTKKAAKANAAQAACETLLKSVEAAPP